MKVNLHQSLRCFNMAVQSPDHFIFIEKEDIFSSKFKLIHVYETILNGQVESLEKVCFRKSIDLIESMSKLRISDYSDKQLIEFGFCQKFVLKLRW